MHVHRTEAGPPGGASPPRDEAPGGFDLLLALHGNEARTATAEGQDRDPEVRDDHGVRAHGDPSVTPGHRKRAEREDENAAEAGAPAALAVPTPEQPAADVAVPAAAPASIDAVATTAPVVPVVPVIAASEAPVPASSAALLSAEVLAAGAPLDAVASPLADAVAADLAAAGEAAVAGEQTVTPGAAALDEAGLPVGTQTAAQAATAEGDEVAAVKPAATSTAAATTAAGDEPATAPATSPARPAGQPSPNAHGARAAEVHEALAAGEKPAPASDKPAAPVAELPAAPAPAAHAAAPARAHAASHALRLAETSLQLRELAEIAASRGVARARLQLHPAELGGIEVRLRVTAEGLTAAISAERPEAAQALQQASAELRRALEQRGLTVLSVDVSLAAPSGGGGETGGSALNAGGDRSASGAGTDPNGGQEAAADAMEADPTTPRGVPAGALVDVLA